MSAYTVDALDLAGVKLITPKVHRDHRGFLYERWRLDSHAELAGGRPFVQTNVSRSRRGVLRGLHFQRPPAEHGKLVGVTRGRVYDVVVDLRRGSPTYLRWLGVELGDESAQMLWVPRGFAHGFLTLSEEADVLYQLDGPHAPEHEGGVRFDDPAIGVDWARRCAAIGIDRPILSERDAHLPLLADVEPAFAHDPLG